MQSMTALNRATSSTTRLISRRTFASTSTPAPSNGTAPSIRRRRSSEPSSDQNLDLVAPPDPQSNIRPIIYASTPNRSQSLNSPYFAGEFSANGVEGKLEMAELEWRLRRERVDMMNHRFWATTNRSFNTLLTQRLSHLPQPNDPPTPEDTKRREDVLDQFYADWQVANRDRMGVWVREWWREVWEGMRGEARIWVLRVFRR